VYLALSRLVLQEALQYRAESVIWFLFDIVPPIMMAFLWLAAYEGQASVAGYDLGSMLLYTLGVMALRNMIDTHIEWDVNSQIREGTLSMHLVRPFNVWGLWFLTGTAWRAMRVMLVTPVLAGCLVWLAPYLQPPELGWELAPLLVLSIALAYLVSFFLKLCVGFTAFWLTEMFGILALVEVTSVVFGGMLLPLDLLPPSLRAVAAALPFQYIYYVPLSAMLGRLEGADFLWALVGQAAWAAALGLLAYAIWRRGLQRYEAFGG
jgi:viologen exporter family transport system permease protein